MGNGTIVATVAANPSVDPRSANITVSVSGLTPIVVAVNQSGAAPLLTVTPPNQNVSNTSGATAFTVSANAPWLVQSDASWCVVTPSGSGNGSITATYENNPLITSRVANVTVTVNGIIPVSVTVTQAAGAATLGIDPHNQNVTHFAGTVNYTVSSNSPWTASSDVTWCTVTPSGTGNGTLVAHYLENALAADRIANITVTVAGLTPSTATLTQIAAPATLTVTPPSRNVTMPAGTTTFNVLSNTDWIATSDMNWCNVTNAGSGNGVITASYSENTGPVVRTANISVSVAGLGPQVVQVVQLPSFVSIGEQPSSTLQVFPNPTSGVFIISSASSSDLQMNVTILDEIGQVVLNKHCIGQTSYTFDLSGSTRGNYFVKAETGGKVLVWKLIIQ